MSTHGKQEITDPVEEMLKKTGCINLHYLVQDCFFETKDWRKCQEQVADFKKCMDQYQQSKTIINFLCKMLKNILTKTTGFETTKMVIIIRTDLKMGKGKIASQAAHTAILLYQKSLDNSNPHLKWWLRMGQPKIVLKVDTNCEEILKNIYKRAMSINLNSCIVRDAGRTQVDTGTITAVGLGPDKNKVIDSLTSDLKLL